MSATGAAAAAPGREESAIGKHMAAHQRARVAEEQALTVPDLRMRVEDLEKELREVKCIAATLWEHWPRRGEFEQGAEDFAAMKATVAAERAGKEAASA